VATASSTTVIPEVLRNRFKSDAFIRQDYNVRSTLSTLIITNVRIAVSHV
jgi:hypothetical protein